MDNSLRWITNIPDPNKPGAAGQFSNRHPDQSWYEFLKWLSDKTIGRPKASDYFTIEQLEDVGEVGVYEQREF
jgi:hypothetical protein